MDDNILCLFYVLSSSFSPTNPCYFSCFIAASDYLCDIQHRCLRFFMSCMTFRELIMFFAYIESSDVLKIWFTVPIWHSQDCASWYILIMKASEMHCFSTLFGKVLYMFQTGHCPSSGVSQPCIHAIGICHASSVGCWGPTELAWQIPIACVQCWDTHDDGQWTCPKHVEYFIK
jgi:hypothetical protein